MKKIKALALIFSLLPCFAAAEKIPGLIDPVVVMDKKTNQLHLCNYNDGKLDIVKTFRATLGQN